MSLARKHRLRTAVTVGVPLAVAVVIAVMGTATHAVEPASTAKSPMPATPSLLQSTRPYWVELTVAQREALRPLVDDWERLDLQTKKKWVEIANRYPKMQPDEQARTQQRMREWAMLTPDQRRVARDSFARVRAMNPDQRADMLRKYRELPPERRQALTSEGQASKVILVPKPMPATSTVPVPRRVELSEGAKVRNPALAAQKSANPIVAPARRPEPPKPVVPAPAPAPTPTDAAAVAAGGAPVVPGPDATGGTAAPTPAPAQSPATAP